MHFRINPFLTQFMTQKMNKTNSRRKFLIQASIFDSNVTCEPKPYKFSNKSVLTQLATQKMNKIDSWRKFPTQMSSINTIYRRFSNEIYFWFKQQMPMAI